MVVQNHTLSIQSAHARPRHCVPLSIKHRPGKRAKNVHSSPAVPKECWPRTKGRAIHSLLHPWRVNQIGLPHTPTARSLVSMLRSDPSNSLLLPHCPQAHLSHSTWSHMQIQSIAGSLMASAKGTGQPYRISSTSQDKAGTYPYSPDHR